MLLRHWEVLEKRMAHINIGLFGDIGVLSFNGNKIITTGGGGALITNNIKLAEKAKFLSKTAKIDHDWEFKHTEIVWNDRMPNINAALGLSQLEALKKRLIDKQKLYKIYKKKMEKFDFAEIIPNPDGCISNNWLVNIMIKGISESINIQNRDLILRKSHSNKIRLRPIWQLINEQRMYKNMPRGDLRIAKDIVSRVISLPSSPQLIKR